MHRIYTMWTWLACFLSSMAASTKQPANKHRKLKCIQWNAWIVDSIIRRILNAWITLFHLRWNASLKFSILELNPRISRTWFEMKIKTWKKMVDWLLLENTPHRHTYLSAACWKQLKHFFSLHFKRALVFQRKMRRYTLSIYFRVMRWQTHAFI